MLKLKTIEVEKEIIESYICDICGTEAKKDSEILQYQEFVTIRHICGYGSVFGDGTIIECDICQLCLQKLLGNNYRVVNY